MSYDLIIFDCDGVLVDSEALTSRVFAEEVARLGLTLDPDLITEKFAGTSMRACLDYVEGLLGKPVPENFEADYRKKSFVAFTNELQPIKGIESVLTQLQQPFCVASNGPRNKIEHNLGVTKLLSYFNGSIFSAYELGIWKPDPQFYQEVAETMGVSPERCLVVEDSISGVRSAVGAGIKVVGYAPESHNEEQLGAEGVMIIKDMSQLPPLIGIPGY